MANLTLTSPTYTTGKFGNCINGGYGQFVSDLIPINLSFTIEAWMQLAAAPGSVKIFTAQNNAFYLGVTSAGFATAQYGSSTLAVTLSGSVNICDGVFHHVALTVDVNNGATLWVDGVSVATNANTPLQAGVQTTRLGTFDVNSFRSSGSSAFDWTGLTDEVALFNYVKYTAGFTPNASAYAGTEQGLLNLWHLDNNGTDSKATATATAIVVSAPRLGANTVAQTYNVSANGAITGTVVVTPAGSGGTFSPTTVSISSGSPTASFTFTPTSTGVKSITVTNDGGLANPAAMPLTVVAVGGYFAQDNAAFLYSPYNWLVNSTEAKTINSGAYFRVRFNGYNAELKFDISNNTAPIPKISYRVDGGPWQRQNIASSINLLMPLGTNNLEHLLEVMVDATSEQVLRWTGGQPSAVKFKGLVASSLVVTAPKRRKKNLIIYGDSITEGVRTRNITNTTSLYVILIENSL